METPRKVESGKLRQEAHTYTAQDGMHVCAGQDEEHAIHAGEHDTQEGPAKTETHTCIEVDDVAAGFGKNDVPENRGEVRMQATGKDDIYACLDEDNE